MPQHQPSLDTATHRSDVTRTPGRPWGFGTLLHHYFFFSWLYADASRGNAFERAAARRYNVANAHWLIVYLRRWLTSGVALYGLAMGIELAVSAPVLSAVFYVASSLCMPICAVIGVAWIGLRN